MHGTAGPRWYVISLRPRGAHAALRRAAQAAGHGFIALSPWRIAVRDDDATRADLHRALASRCAVFTSPQAVHAALKLGAQVQSVDTLAVGMGTAKALRRAGAQRVTHPERMDSEGVLALPALANVRGVGIGLVTAPGGRNAIAPALRARGACVHRADVYAREPLPLPASAVRRLRELEAALAIAASSGEALQHVFDQADDDVAARLRGACVLAASDRIAAIAHALGCTRIVRAAGPMPAQLIAALNATHP